MSDPRQQHGNHTWDLILHYYRCPKCGYVIENRDKYERRMALLQKEVACPRCEHVFTVTKDTKPTFGPFFGSYESF